MSKIDELTKLNDLRESGAITEEEFTRLKAELLGKPEEQAPVATYDITGGAAKEYVELQKTEFQVDTVIGIIVTIVILIILIIGFSKAFQGMDDMRHDFNNPSIQWGR